MKRYEMRDAAMRPIYGQYQTNDLVQAQEWANQLDEYGCSSKMYEFASDSLHSLVSEVKPVQ
jgi:hypothetical protein